MIDVASYKKRWGRIPPTLGEGFFNQASSDEMATTSSMFAVGPEVGAIWHVASISLTLVDNGDFNIAGGFGAGAALSSGILFFVNREGQPLDTEQLVGFGPIKTNADLMRLASWYRYDAWSTDRILTARFDFAAPIELTADDDDSDHDLLIYTQDDMSALVSLKAYARGYWHAGAGSVT